MDTVYAGNIGEEAVREELRKFKGSKLSGFIRSKNIVYYGKNFQLDFLVFVPKIGLVVLEVKRWQGTIRATCDDKWTQEYGAYKKRIYECLKTSIKNLWFIVADP